MAKEELDITNEEALQQATSVLLDDLGQILKRTTFKVSVRALVEFILRHGDITVKGKASPENAMLMGSKIHRMIQGRQKSDYHSEVPLAFLYDAGEFDIVIDGRADGIIIDEKLLEKECAFEADNRKLETEAAGGAASEEFELELEKTAVTIDEIKGVYRDIFKMHEPEILHLAQAKVYAAIYLIQNNLPRISVRITYCHLETEQIRYFNSIHEAEELKKWFYELLDSYKKWALFKYNWKKQRKKSIKNLQFPYEYRDGQKELSEYVYRTIYHKKRLFIEAPTGVGKTIATVFPTLKAIGEDKADIMFYLTAKTITASVASNAFNLLREKQNLKLKSVQITAKEKLCLAEECVCDPAVCPYAKGHFDRINDAMYDLLNSEDEYMRETILEYARKHMVCPFEFCLDMSLFSDAIICDYNYLFDPDVYLRRFFAEGIRGDYVFLVDEAHNLVDRAREMYSAEMIKEDVLEIKKLIGDLNPKLTKALNKTNKILLDLKRECNDTKVLNNIDPLVQSLVIVQGRLEDFMDDEDAMKYIGNGHDKLLDFFFEVRHFLNMAETLDESYVIYSYFRENEEFAVKLFCIHPANHLKECLQRGISTIFFSATILPIDYYIDLLTNDMEDYAVYAKSSFDPSSRGVFIANDVSSKYTRRGPAEYKKIAEYIVKTIKIKSGNYMAFFPSYKFMEDVRGYIVQELSGEGLEAVDILTQDTGMTEMQREEFLAAFENGTDSKRTLLGLCVLGGIFSEGIDLKNDSLIGAIIVGTGLPQVCTERELIKDYFDSRGQNGFDFAYRHPGMNKVLQAAGRVIRTAEDVGIVLLLDERFLSGEYRSSYPREWENIKVGSNKAILPAIENFWVN